MKMKDRRNYRIQDGCWNCGSCKCDPVHRESDYCTKDTPTRECGPFGYSTDNVSSYGICDEHVKQ